MRVLYWTSCVVSFCEVTSSTCTSKWTARSLTWTLVEGPNDSFVLSYQASIPTHIMTHTHTYKNTHTHTHTITSTRTKRKIEWVRGNQHTLAFYIVAPPLHREREEITYTIITPKVWPWVWIAHAVEVEGESSSLLLLARDVVAPNGVRGPRPRA